MKGKLEIQTESAEFRSTFKSWARTTKGSELRKDTLGDSPRQLSLPKVSRTKSHAQIMRTSMKTFLTELNIPFPPHKSLKDTNEIDDENEKKMRKSSYGRIAPECNFLLNRVEKTVDRLQKLNEKFQKSMPLSNPQVLTGPRVQSRGSRVSIFSPTGMPLFPNSRPDTRSLPKSGFPEYIAKDFEDPDGNLSLIEAIKLIDGNKKSDVVADAMWVDLGEGYKLYDHLVHERKTKEIEMRNLQENLRSLTVGNDNQKLHNEITELKNQIKEHEQQVNEDEMEYEILERMLSERKAQAELFQQRFLKKYENLPKIELGLQLGINEIKKDTLHMENTMNSIGTMYATLRSMQKLSKSRESSLRSHIKENHHVEKNIAIEQDFKEQREEYIKMKNKDHERELHRQENELHDRIVRDIGVCEKQIAEQSDNVEYIMKNTKQENKKEDILAVWQELLNARKALLSRVDEAELEQNILMDKLNEEQQDLDVTKANKLLKTELNDIPELSQKENEVEKAQRELEKEQAII